MLNVAFAIFFLGLRSDFLQKLQTAPSDAPEAPEQDEWTRVPPCHPAHYNDKAASQPASIWEQQKGAQHQGQRHTPAAATAVAAALMPLAQ